MSESLKKRIEELEKENQELRLSLENHKKFVKRTFGRFLTEEVAEEILSRDDKEIISGERRIITILFADIRNSTYLSEKMEAMNFIGMLNHFLERSIDIINAWQGNILEFAGDAIVAAFGAPRINDTAARDAVACSVALQNSIPKINAWNRKKGYPEIEIGIGIHTGEAILGTIGSPIRSKYDMIGRNVNLASRIEGYAEGGHILITKDTLKDAGDEVKINEYGTMTINPKGIQGDILVYDVAGYGSKIIPVFDPAGESCD